MHGVEVVFVGIVCVGYLVLSGLLGGCNVLWRPGRQVCMAWRCSFKYEHSVILATPFSLPPSSSCSTSA